MNWQKSLIVSLGLAATAGCALMQQPGRQSQQDSVWIREREWSRDQAVAQQQDQQALQQSIMGMPEADQTTLERLQKTVQELQMARSESKRMEQEVEALTATIDQLRSDNESMQGFVDSLQTDREGITQEMDDLQLKIQELTTNYRALSEELLAERIQRVRVERELILAKIAEAERADEE